MTEQDGPTLDLDDLTEAELAVILKVYALLIELANKAEREAQQAGDGQETKGGDHDDPNRGLQ